MLKVIVLLIGLVVGFFAGNRWSVQNPDKAQVLSEEGKRFLEKQLELARETKARLDQVAAKGTAGGPSGSGFLPGGARKPDPEIDRLRGEQQGQINELEKMLEKAKK